MHLYRLLRSLHVWILLVELEQSAIAADLGMPQCLETSGKMLCFESAWHSSSGRHGQPMGLGTVSSEVSML